MKRAMFFLAAAFLVPSILSAPVQDPRFGESRESIISMGLNNWVEFYFSKAGDKSETTEDKAHIVYADCLKEQNQEKIASLQQLDRDRLTKYAPYIAGWRLGCIQIAEGYAGGGTLYAHTAQRTRVAEEELMQKLIEMNTRPMAEPTRDRLLEIQDMIGKIRKRLGEKARLSPDARAKLNKVGIDPKKIDAACIKAGRAYDAILNIMPRERQDECLALLNSFWDWLVLFDGH